MDRNITALSKQDVRKFIRMCAEDRTTGDFEIYLGLSRNEVLRLKGNLGIQGPQDAKDLLKDVVLLEEKEDALRKVEHQAVLNRQREEAQTRLDASNARRELERSDKKRRVLSVTKIKNQDKKRQQKFEKQQEKAKPIKKDGWRLPTNVNPEDFARDLRVRGIRFTCDRYGIARSDIMSEVARLKLKIDFDLLPR